MSLCVIVTRDVEARYRGFLGSAMLELAPGVYANPRITKAVRERIWRVLTDWHGQLRRGSIVMCWADANAPSSIGLETLGEPPKDVVEHEGVLLVRRLRSLSDEEPDQDSSSLTTE